MRVCQIPLRLAAFVLLGASLLHGQNSDPEPEANPERPTISNPATLTPVGYLQFESGSFTARHSPEFKLLTSFNEVVKLTVQKRVEFLASAQPVVHYSAGGNTATGTADVLLGVQTVLHAGKGVNPTVSASYFRRVYAGSTPDVDFGTPDNSFLLLASADWNGFHYDTNALFNEMQEARVHRLQFGQTLSVSHNVGKRFSVTGELWHFTQPFLRGHASGNLWALGYTARKILVLDAGFNRGLTATSTRWEVFAGFTYLLPHRLWHYSNFTNGVSHPRQP